MVSLQSGVREASQIWKTRRKSLEYRLPNKLTLTFVMGSMCRAFLWFYTAATVLSVSSKQTQRSLCAVILHSGSLTVVWLHAALQTEPRSAPLTLAPTLTRTCEAVRAFLEQWLLEAPHHRGPRPLLLSCNTLTRECWPLNTVNWPLSHTGALKEKVLWNIFLEYAFPLLQWIFIFWPRLCILVLLM